MDGLKAKIKPFLTDIKLMQQFRVYELAKESSWETRAESKATESWCSVEELMEGEETQADGFIGRRVGQWYEEARNS